MTADETKGSRGKDLLPKGTKMNPCDFIEDPWDECYCATMSSVKSEAAIYYCGEHFEACPIYRRRMKAQEDD